MNTKEFLIKRISELEKELNGLRAALSAYESSSTESIINSEYVKDNQEQSKEIYDGTWIENILTVIKNKNRFLHNTEIADELYASYADKDKKSVKRRISAVLSSALSKGEIDSLTNYRFSNSVKDTVWGKKEWLNEQGKIKNEYMFTSKDDNKNNKTFDF